MFSKDGKAKDIPTPRICDLVWHDGQRDHWKGDGIKLHPDGKQIAFAAGGQSEEIWAIENLPPDLRARK